MKVESSQEVLSPEQWALEKLKEAKLKAKNENALALVPNRIVIIPDVSSSMAASFGNSTRIAAAKHGLDSIIQTSDRRETHYSLITFNHESFLIHPMGTGYAKFLTTDLIPSGGTRLTPALELALVQNPNRVIVLTDGELDHYDAHSCAQTNYIPRKIKIDTIAIGEANAQFLRELSEITGGTFQHASTPEELEKIFISLEPRNYLLLEHKS